MPRSLSRLACLLASLLFAAACTQLPADPERTLERARGGVIRAGVVDDPPLLDAASQREPRGPEIDALRLIARDLDARIEWRRGNHDRLMEELEGFHLDLVVGGTAVDSPWKERVALSHAYRLRGPDGAPVMRVLALPPGENGWRRELERLLEQAHVRAALRSSTGPPR